MSGISVTVSVGELIDKITILEIKQARIHDPGAASEIARELTSLREAWAAQPHPALEDLPEWSALCAVNGELWEVEDALRDHERAGRFDASFIALARSVYQLNDQRAAIKRAMNEALGTRLREQKSYGDKDEPLQGRSSWARSCPFG